jgi:hypothetical protein
MFGEASWTKPSELFGNGPILLAAKESMPKLVFLVVPAPDPVGGVALLVARRL